MGKGAQVKVWLSGELLARMDRERGTTSRGLYLRALAFPQGSEPTFDLLSPEGRQAALAHLIETMPSGEERRKGLVNLDAMCRADADQRRKDELPDTLRNQTKAMDAVTGVGDSVDRDIEPPPAEAQH